MHSIFHLKFIRTPWCSLWFVYVNNKIMWSIYSHTHPHISAIHMQMLPAAYPKCEFTFRHWITSYFTNYICLLTLHHFCLFSYLPKSFCFLFLLSLSVTSKRWDAINWWMDFVLGIPCHSIFRFFVFLSRDDWTVSFVYISSNELFTF